VGRPFHGGTAINPLRLYK